MTQETLIYCRRYVTLCLRILDPAIAIETRMDEAEQLVCLRTYLNETFARQFEYAELEAHCRQLIAAWEQAAA